MPRPRELCDDCFYRVILESTDPVLSSSEIADRADLDPETIRRRGLELATAGRIHTKVVGRTRIYWLTDSSRLSAMQDECSCGQRLGISD